MGGAGESELTAQVRRVVEEAVRESDLLLFVVDAKQGLSPIDQELARILRKSRKPIVLVINKIDDPKHENLAMISTRWASKEVFRSAPRTVAASRICSKQSKTSLGPRIR